MIKVRECPICSCNKNNVLLKFSYCNLNKCNRCDFVFVDAYFPPRQIYGNKYFKSDTLNNNKEFKGGYIDYKANKNSLEKTFKKRKNACLSRT